MPEPRGQAGGQLTGVSCTSATHCVAVSNQDYSEIWNGRVWKVAPSAGGSVLSVSCTSYKFCVAAGASADVWNGSTWTAMTVPTPVGAVYDGFYSVSCGSPTSCAIAGFYEMNEIRYSLLDLWDGTSWTQQSLPASAGTVSLNAVSCPRPGNACTAVGSLGTGQNAKPLVEHWNGTEWKRTPASSTRRSRGPASSTLCPASPRSPAWRPGPPTPSTPASSA
ncbi:MAG TPA: hypothetical protein VGH27_32645 [Streptosporangiaceae bacterium]